MSATPDPWQLLADGRLEEAELNVARRLEGAPDDVAALHVSALIRMGRGEIQAAGVALERAAVLQPSNALLMHHLARARDALGDAAGALDADASAVAGNPGYAQGRLFYGASLERAGRIHDAVSQYARALRDAQADGRWNDAATTPEVLRPLIERAVTTVRQHSRATLDAILAPLITRYGRSGLERVFGAIRIYLGEQRPSYPDPRQRPTFFYIPGLPATPYFDRRMFPWIAGYEAAYPEILRELEGVLHAPAGRERVFGSDELEAANLRGHDVTPSWNGYYFYRHGERREDNANACPATAGAIDAITIVRIPEHGPEAMFSVFTPGTHLLPHRGVTNARAVSHLPLIVPPDCALNVGGEQRAWQEGQAFVFDDTYEHEAWNRSDRVRVVLIVDVWNPHLTDMERAAVSDVIVGAGELRKTVDNA